MPLIISTPYTNPTVNSIIPGWSRRSDVRPPSARTSDGRSICSRSADGQTVVALPYAVSKDGGVTFNNINPPATNNNNFSIQAMSKDGKYMLGNAYLARETLSVYAWVSSDFGATWVSARSNRNISAYAMDDSGQYMIIATESTSNGSVLISTDYGNTFRTTGSTTNGGWAITALMSGNGLVAYKYGLSRSNDHGNTWVAIPGPVTAAHACSDDGSVVLLSNAFGVQPSEIWVSTNYGTGATKLVDSVSAKRWAISGDGNVIAAFGAGGIYISRNRGVSYSVLANPYPDEGASWGSTFFNYDGSELLAEFYIPGNATLSGIYVFHI